MGFAADNAPHPFTRENRVCAQCHAKEATSYPLTSMAHAAESVSECAVLRSRPLLTLTLGRYSYKIERKGDQSTYTVTDGTQTVSFPIKWALGLGFAGQTYLLEKDGILYESYVSYYKEPDALDITIGDQPIHPTNIMEAAGRRIGDRESRLCVGCHTTNSLIGNTLQVDTLTPGVQCERCHGPTENHLEGLKKGDPKQAEMKKLGPMTAEEGAAFCGQCHRTWEQIATGGPRGTSNVRFQPYRLTNSKCYDIDDPRISCTTCHDPHRNVDKVSADYDVNCQACHAGGKPGARICKVATKNCSSCHMPKIEVPGSHHLFTDHTIRIATGSYPD
jgi:hypothetical protein